MKTYTFKAKVWVYPGMAHSTSSGQAGSWHFITVPKKESADIKTKYGKHARGWGSLRVSVTIGKTQWQTSIFPDKKSGTYLLPVKAEVRRKEGLFEADTVKVSCTLL